jgi:dTMP kinase
MPPRGKLIVFEGIDGSGKRTQLDLLTRTLTERGIAHERISFPRYDGFFGAVVAKYLNGDFGGLDKVDAHLSAILYAGDRFEAKPKIETILASGKLLVADRYIASNLAHQGARVPSENREEFLAWLKKLEYEIYGLPAEDLVIYLRVPADAAHAQVGAKGARDYTNLKRDIQESNIAHLSAASEVYDTLSRSPNWVKIECVDATRSGHLRAPEEIHREVFAAVESRIGVARTAP